MKAANLADGMENFSPAPIDFGPGGNADFYVERSDDPLQDLRTRLLLGKTARKFLLAGHRGSGKSTELNRLMADPEIRRRYAVVKFSVKDELNLTDLSHIDLLFTMSSLTYDSLVSGENGLEVSGEAIEHLDVWRRAVEERISTRDASASAEASAGAKLDIKALLGRFFAGFSGRLRVEQQTRQVTREIVEPRLSEFLESLNRFFFDIDLALGQRDQRLLLVIEDLDKIPDINKALELFHHKGLYLAKPQCRIIYTVPIAIHYAKDFQAVAGTLGQSFFLPNIALRERKNPHIEYRRGRDMMERFIRQRLDASLIEEEALSEAVTASGGVFQQLQRLMEDACTRGLSRGLPAVTVEETRDAAAELRNELERMLATGDYPILAKVASTSQAASDEETLRLLHSLHLVEYRNRERWCSINPLLEPTLSQWHKTSGVGDGPPG